MCRWRTSRLLLTLFNLSNLPWEILLIVTSWPACWTSWGLSDDATAVVSPFGRCWPGDTTPGRIYPKFLSDRWPKVTLWSIPTVHYCCVLDFLLNFEDSYLLVQFQLHLYRHHTLKPVYWFEVPQASLLIASLLIWDPILIRLEWLKFKSLLQPLMAS
jgi:hypothetical protein